MNGEVEQVCYAPDAVRRLDRAGRWLLAFEERFSRFRPLSELSRLNAAAGRPFCVSPALFTVVELALGLARHSGGVFDPTVLAALAAAGYDRTFENVRSGNARGTSGAGRFSWRDVTVDQQCRTVHLPAGVGIDLGGIGKSWAVDRLASILGSPCLVNGGGDVYAAGRPHDAPAWLVGVADPFAPERDVAVLEISDRGVATSSRLRRRWRADGEWLHHLIDPRTGAPSRSEVVQCTAVASNAVRADYSAKVTLLLGATNGLAFLNCEPDVEGLLVLQDGSLLLSNSFGGRLS